MGFIKPRTDLTAEQVREALDYDPETGAFTWRRREETHWRLKFWNTRYAGKTAGSVDRIPNSDRSYVRIMVNRKFYKAHRLAWLHHYGEWPDGEIDHIDRDGTNNRISNLRVATRSQNMANRKTNRANKSGLKGVTRNGNNYMALIACDGRNHYLGTFKTPEEAHAAYMEAAQELHGEFARTE